MKERSRAVSMLHVLTENLRFSLQFCDGSGSRLGSVSANQLGGLKAMPRPHHATFYLPPPAHCCMSVRPSTSPDQRRTLSVNIGL